MTKNRASLAFCILMDLIGFVSYSIPFLGELIDIIWAPISAIIFFMTFGGWKGAFGSVFNLVEELLPGVDFMPSFTIMWFMRNFNTKKSQQLPASDLRHKSKIA